MNWYALFVETDKEETVSKYIKNQLGDCIRTLIPKRMIPEKRNGVWFDIEKKLFPGYIFILTYMDNVKYYALKQIPHVIKLLTQAPDYDHIKQSEISIILHLTNNNGIIEYSKIYVQNSTVTIIDGPLKGYKGLIKKIDKHSKRIKIQINLMGEPRLVDLGMELVI